MSTKVAWGCGIIDIETQNRAFISKLIYKSHTEPQTLWVRILKGKYKFNLIEEPPKLSHTSHFSQNNATVGRKLALILNGNLVMVLGSDFSSDYSIGQVEVDLLQKISKSQFVNFQMETHGANICFATYSHKTFQRKSQRWISTLGRVNLLVIGLLMHRRLSQRNLHMKHIKSFHRMMLILLGSSYGSYTWLNELESFLGFSSKEDCSPMWRESRGTSLKTRDDHRVINNLKISHTHSSSTPWLPQFGRKFFLKICI